MHRVHNGETKPGTTAVPFHRDGRTLVVNQVPSDVCANCGEACVGEDITAQLQAIAGEAREVQVLIRDFAPAA